MKVSGKQFANGRIIGKNQNMSKQPPSKDQASIDSTSMDKDIDKDEAAFDSPSIDSSIDREEDTEVLASDPDPVQIGETAAEAAAEGLPEARAADEPDADTDPDAALAATTAKPAVAAVSPSLLSRISWFGLFNFVLILALAAAAGYYWQQQQQQRRQVEATYQADLADLAQRQRQIQLSQKASSSELQSSLAPLEGKLTGLDRQVDELGLGQQSLRESSIKLYELFGRDKNDWQLAEVEYLMRVAQHKLILQDDFEGAAITLQAASDRIGLTGDPGLLPVRVTISEEIAQLKTRRRADLVGMTLILAQLGRQVRGLQPGFAVRVEQTDVPTAQPQSARDWVDRFSVFLDSLISVRKEATEPTEIEANIIDVTEAMEDNLKLARWAVLERDARQYQMLIDRSLQLFREFYDLDNAANHDFMTQMQELQKMVIKPEKPDITGSLRELQRILSQRDSAPQPAVTPTTEPDNG